MTWTELKRAAAVLQAFNDRLIAGLVIRGGMPAADVAAFNASAVLDSLIGEMEDAARTHRGDGLSDMADHTAAFAAIQLTCPRRRT